MSARDNWGQVAHNLRVLADSIDAAIETPASAPASGAAPPPTPSTQQQHVDTALGICPVHRTAWSARPGGVSKKTGRTYKGFWSCSQRTDDGGYCSQKPVAAWADTHPIPEAG